MTWALPSVHSSSLVSPSTPFELLNIGNSQTSLPWPRPCSPDLYIPCPRHPPLTLTAIPQRTCPKLCPPVCSSSCISYFSQWEHLPSPAKPHQHPNHTPLHSHVLPWSASSLSYTDNGIRCTRVVTSKDSSSATVGLWASVSSVNSFTIFQVSVWHILFV